MMTSRRFAAYFILPVFFYSSVLLASHELQVKEHLCFEKIFGSFIAEPYNNSIWYKKISVYSKYNFQWNDNEEKNFIPELHNCNQAVIRYVPLIIDYSPPDEDLFNIASMEITKPLIKMPSQDQVTVSELQFEVGSSNSNVVERLDSDLGEFSKEFEYTRYFHRKRHDGPYTDLPHVRPTDLNDDINPKIWVNTIGSYLYIDPITSHPPRTWKPEEVMKHLGGQHRPDDSIKTDLNIDSFLDNPVVLTANNCWLIQPSVRTNECRNTERSSTVAHKTLKIHSLLTKDSVDGHRCIKFKFPQQNLSGDNKALWKSCSEEMKEFKTSFELFDFPDYRIGAAYDNPGSVGLDYDYLSVSPEELELIYQRGYVKSSLSEKLLEGALVYRKFIRLTDDPVDQRKQVDLAIDRNISKICKQQNRYLGWVSNPIFSREGDIVYFLALSEKGNDVSRNNIYSFIKSKLLVNNKSFDCRKDIKNLTGKFNFDEPIRRYKVSSALSKLTVIFEKKGGSVVRFFRLNPSTGEIAYKYPYELNWPGFITDVVQKVSSTPLGNEAGFYIMASTLNTPTAIYPCSLFKTKIQCEDKPHSRGNPYNFEDMMSMHNMDSGRKVELSRLPIYSEDNDVFIDTYVFTPTDPDPDRKAIISIHGGPNESWDGRFARLEYMLAKQGYTVYMPNPTGSTGYGYNFSNASRYSWGTRIYDDIKNVVKSISDKKKHGGIIIKGFSFGGYMVNWIQTRSKEEKEKYFKDVDAFIAINPAYDLRDFASSTDQYWFPQYQLGCSGPECLSLPACDIPGNPACYSDDNLGKGKIIPTMLLAGCYDRRIPVRKNTGNMELAYQANKVPYTAIDPPTEHGFSMVDDHNYAIRIHKWISDLYRLKNEHRYSDHLNCQIEKNQFDHCEDKPVLTKVCL